MFVYLFLIIFSTKKTTIKKVESAFEIVKHFDSLGSVFSDTSELNFINIHAGIQPVTISNEMKDIIESSLKYCQITNGAFDVTVLPLMRLWDFLSENPRIPDDKEIKKKLKLVNYKNIVLEDNKISFKMKGMGIDPGGFLKGYAVDKVYEKLEEDGFKKFVVNMGGNLRVYIVDDDTATIKIQHPRDEDTFWGKFEVQNASVATSGDYERFFEIDSIKYHHILNPSNGYPASSCVSVTIITDTAFRADAFSTAVFVMGPEKGMEFVNKYDDVESVIVFNKGKMLESVVSDGMFKKYKYVEYE